MTDQELIAELTTRLHQRHKNRDRVALDTLEAYLVKQADRYDKEGREDAWVATDLALECLREIRETGRGDDE